MTVVINKSRHSIKQEKKTKKCLHFGCEKEFIGLNRSKYCSEHNTRWYRKVRNVKQCDNNILINVNNINIISKNICCSHWSCNKFYEILTSSDIKTYPKYCEDHRNKYKRGYFGNEKL